MWKAVAADPDEGTRPRGARTIIMTKTDDGQNPNEATRILLEHLRRQRPGGEMPDTDHASYVGEETGPKADDDPAPLWSSETTFVFDRSEVHRQIRLLAPATESHEEEPGAAHLPSEENTRLEKLRWLSRQDPAKTLLFGTAQMRVRLDVLRRRCPGFGSVTDLVDRAVALSIHTKTPLSIPPLLLVGPPGVGKTHYSKALAAVLGVPVHAWSCATNSDAMQLVTGHPTSWRGSRMGHLTETIVDSPGASPVFLLDEIDKFVTHWAEKPYNVLLNILEEENSRALLDEYVRVRFDLSQCIFICTANDLSALPEFIIDRLLVVSIAPPDRDDLIAIARQIAAKIIEPLAPAVAMPEEAVLARLARGNPRGIARIVRLALGFAAADGREDLAIADVDAAAALAASEPERLPMGFVMPMRKAEAESARKGDARNGRTLPNERES
ncbi:MAG: hypothetical protein ABS54_06140 [Hyphomicrobium sp. SCN 65-11]|nr:MAG: hypothetical protein ABS54_06140 [Hyphomicrobium sp. SCN 65-11]